MPEPGASPTSSGPPRRTTRPTGQARNVSQESGAYPLSELPPPFPGREPEDETQGGGLDPTPVALYIRARPEYRGEPFQEQLDVLLRYARSHNKRVVRGYFEAPGSGIQFGRLIMEAAGRQAPFREILVESPDHLADSPEEVTERTRRLAECGVALLFISEPSCQAGSGS